MRLSLREAFDLEPALELKLGDRLYAVPPLTFGRFDELLRQVWRVAGLRDVMQEAAAEMTVKPGRDLSAAEIAARLRRFPSSALEPLARIVVPGLRAEDWAKADIFTLQQVYLFFFRIHDWPFIGDAMGFGKPPEDAAVGNDEIAAMLLTVAGETGLSLPAVLGLRLEGFYLSLAGIRSRRDMTADAQERAERSAEGWEGPRPVENVVPLVRDPEHAAHLTDLFKKAELSVPKEEVPGG